MLEAEQTAGGVVPVKQATGARDWDYVYYWQLWHLNWDNRDVDTIKRLCCLEGKTVLEVGCGDGRITRMLAPDCARIIGVDREPRFIEIAKTKVADSNCGNVEFAVMDACQLELADDSVDIVLYPWVLQMVSSPQAAVQETYRVLKPGGKLVIVGLLSDADYDRIIDRFVPDAPPIDPNVCYDIPLAESFQAENVEKLPKQSFDYFFESKEVAYDAFDFALEYWYGKEMSNAERLEMKAMVDKHADGKRIKIAFPACVYLATK